MSRKSHATRTLAAAGAVAFAALGAAAPAQALTKTLNYECKYPLIVPGKIAVDVTMNIPESWPLDTPTERWAINAVAKIGGTTPADMGSIKGLTVLKGQAGADAVLEWSDGRAATEVSVDLAVAPHNYVKPSAGGPSVINISASGSTPQLLIETAGTATIKITNLLLNMEALDAAGAQLTLAPVSKNWDGTPHVDSDNNPKTFDVVCRPDPASVPPFDPTLATVVFGGPPPPPPTDTEGPTTPGEVDMGDADVGTDFLNIKWGPSTDLPAPPNNGLKGYIVEIDGDETFVPAGTHSYRAEGLGPASEYEVNIYAVDNKDFRSDVPLYLPLTTKDGPPPPPVDTVAPTDGTASATKTWNSAVIKWTAASDNVGVTGYRVFNGTTQVGGDLAADKRELAVPNLTPETLYNFSVVAFDAKNNKSTGAKVSFTTDKKPVDPPVETQHFSYSLKGSTVLKTLTKGTLPLAGGIEADIDLSTGKYTADLTLNQTTGRLTALGFLPVTAKIGFAPSGKTVGTLDEGVLTTSSKVRIKVQEVKLFGAIPLAGGNNCQTKSLSQIDLKSTNVFNPNVGGDIAGTYKISDLNGCGVLNGLVSPLTAGGGNTIALKLTAKP